MTDSHIQPYQPRVRSSVGRCLYPIFLNFFFFNDTATTEIYTLSLHDALPIFGSLLRGLRLVLRRLALGWLFLGKQEGQVDPKSTRLNSSHHIISYAVFCL